MSESILSNSIKSEYKGIYSKSTKLGIAYIARYTINKKTRTQIVGYEKDGMSPFEAFKIRQNLISSLELCRALEINSPSEYETTSLFEKFMKFRKPYLAKNTSDNIQSIYNQYISKDFKNKDVRNITITSLQVYINSLLEYRRPATVEKIVSSFKKFYKYLQDDGVVKHNIASNLVLPKYDNKKYFSMSKKDVKKLIEYINNISSVLYKTLYYMLLHGRRIGECLQIRWTDIDFTQKIYHLDYKSTKNRKNQYFYLEDFQIRQLLELRKISPNSIYVFENPNTKLPIRYTSFFRVHSKLRLDLEMPDFNIHSLRHLCGFLLINKGYSLEITAKILGHQNISSTIRYANIEMTKAKNAYRDTFRGYM